MERSDKKKAGIAIVAVPVIAAGTVAMVSAYKQGSTFTPSGAKQDFQANKVVFDHDEMPWSIRMADRGMRAAFFSRKIQKRTRGRISRTRQIICLKTSRSNRKTERKQR